MITITEEKVLARVAALSAAEHYYSHRGSARAAEEVRRAPLFGTSRHPLVGVWVEDACCDVIGLLAGWTRYADYENGELSLALKERYAAREAFIEHTVEELIAADVWRRIAAQTAPEAAERSELRRERLQHRILCLMLEGVS